MKDKEPAPTLADALVRETFSKKTLLPLMLRRDVIDLRMKVAGARKIVLDPGMSAFLADLSFVPFDVEVSRRPDILDCMRHGARLPYPVTWLEWDGPAFKRRLIETKQTILSSPPRSITGEPLSEDVPPKWGFLLEEHPQLPWAIKCQEFHYLDEADGWVVSASPWDYLWQCNDDPLPWPTADHLAGSLAHGIIGIKSPQIAVRYHDVPMLKNAKNWVPCEFGADKFRAPILLVEMAGSLRYLLSFLATFNDIPAIHETVRSSKGYMARGRYRQYQEHTVLHVNIPGKRDPRVLAKRLFVAARRRWHQVRGHWRVLTHHAQHREQLCAPAFHHGPFATFGPEDENGYQYCLKCEARRLWIDRYDRGDPTLGIVLHDYQVHHSRTKE